MRILHCLRAPVGGLFRHVLDLAEEQARRGHDVGIIADSHAENALTASKFSAIEPLMRLGVKRIPIGRRPGLGDLAAARTVRAHAATLDLDVLHGHGAKGGAYARLAAWRLRGGRGPVRSYYTPHGGVLSLPGGLETRVLMQVERGLESLSTGLIFESAYAARRYRRHVRATGAPERIIPNGLKPEDFAPADPLPEATDLLFVGELRHLKGIDVLLQAMARLKAERPVTATIVGAGADVQDLLDLTRSLGLEGAVTFTGALPVRDAFRLGRIMVVPSRAESFPYIVLEAGAAGLPLIATNVGGIPEIVADTDTGLIAPDDPAGLADAIARILADPRAAEARAGRLRANVAAKFTVAAMTDAVLDFYETTAAARARLPYPKMKLQSHRG